MALTALRTSAGERRGGLAALLLRCAVSCGGLCDARCGLLRRRFRLPDADPRLPMAACARTAIDRAQAAPPVKPRAQQRRRPGRQSPGPQAGDAADGPPPRPRSGPARALGPRLIGGGPIHRRRSVSRLNASPVNWPLSGPAYRGTFFPCAPIHQAAPVSPHHSRRTAAAFSLGRRKEPLCRVSLFLAGHFVGQNFRLGQLFFNISSTASFPSPQRSPSHELLPNRTLYFFTIKNTPVKG